MTLYHSRGAAIDYRKLNPGDSVFLELPRRFGVKRFDGEMQFFEQGEIGNLNTNLRNWTTSEIEKSDTNLRNWVITEIGNIATLGIDSIVGTVQMGFWIAPPTNYLFCWGQTLNKIDFPKFWEFAKNWNNGTHSWDDLFGIDAHTVSLPNTSNEFLRGASNTRLLGTKQLDALQDITGTIGQSRSSYQNISGAFTTYQNRKHVLATSYAWYAREDFDVIFDASRVARTSNETRARNIAVNFAIKVI